MTIRTLEELNAVVDQILATKQTPKTLQALTTTTSFSATDYLITSSATTGNTNKIAKQSFVDAIGNPVIDGYNCVSDDVDEYTLTPVSGNAVSQYYTNMTVSFVADENSVGSVQIRIGTLPYIDFFRYNTNATVEVVAGEYYEAVYFDGNFYQTNAKSEGLPTLVGYNSSSASANEITLTSINNIEVDNYVNNLNIGFISPITSTGNVTIQIDGLAFRDFYQFGTVNAVALEENQYYQAIYIGDALAGNFYLTNAKDAALFSNEYIAEGTVALDELSTTYQLTSAIGSPKTEYYPSMSLIFTADISSKGVVFVNVDGLGNKVLGEGINDPIANNLYAGQPLLATYNNTTGEFDKHRFATTNPPAPPIDPEEPIPDENLVAINVGPTHPIKTITDAIKALVQEFGNDGGNRLATIHLADDFIWAEKVDIPTAHDYSWITIISDVNININAPIINAPIMQLSIKSVSPIISGIYTWLSGSSYHTIFKGSSSSIFNVLNLTLTIGHPSLGVGFECDGLIGDNLNITGGETAILSGSGDAKSLVQLKNSTLLNCDSYAFYGSQVNVEIIDSLIESNPTGNFLVYLQRFTTFNAINSTFKSNKTIISLNYDMEFAITNCRINSVSNTQIGFICNTGTSGTIDGGDYRTNDNSVINTNIVADGSGTIIRLVNNPLGGTHTTNSGQIITI